MTAPTWLRQKNLIAMKIEFVGSVSHLNAKCLNSEAFWFIKWQEGHRLNLSVICCFLIFPQRCQHRVNLSLLFPSWPSGNCPSVVLRKKKKWLLGPSGASPSSVTPPSAIPLQRWQTELVAGSSGNVGAAGRASDTQTRTSSCISRMCSIFIFPIIAPTRLGFVKNEKICGKIFSQQEEKPAKVILTFLSPTLWEAGNPGDCNMSRLQRTRFQCTLFL